MGDGKRLKRVIEGGGGYPRNSGSGRVGGGGMGLEKRGLLEVQARTIGFLYLEM